LAGLASYSAIHAREQVQQFENEAGQRERDLRDRVDALQAKLQDELKKQVVLTIGIAEATGRASAIAGSDPSNQAIHSLTEQLKRALQEFRAQVSPDQMSVEDDL